MIQKLTACWCLLMISHFASAQSFIDSIITTEKLKETVYYLAADSLQGRYTNTAECNIAATFIASKLQAAGVMKIHGMNGYFSNYDGQPNTVRNVLGVLPGKENKKDEIIIISAHYDHIGVTGKWKLDKKHDVVYNGANDDASGIAAMLALADYFGKRERSRTIMFIAFSGEEVGLLGSRATAKEIKPQMITAQINLEMLGRKGGHQRPFVTGDWHSDLRDLLNKNLSDSTGNKEYFEKDNDRGNLFLRSDNIPFAGLGIPAHTIMLTTDDDQYYHTVYDEAATLDYDNMCGIVKNIAIAITPLINGMQTPWRISVSRLPASAFN